MAVARPEAARIGWKFEGPFKLITATGMTVSMIEVSPKMVQTMAVQSHQAKLEQKAAINLGRPILTLTEVVLQPII
eukprot:1243173-Heterocapsa_arctica.AAC.1